jgi:serine/threonine protein kinase
VSIAGTLHYAAPEQLDFERQKEVGPRSDVYGFGRTCYYALFGTPTPDDDDKDTLPDGLKRLLSRCTSQALAKRPQSFTEVVQQLKEIEEALIPTVEKGEPVGGLEVVEEEKWYYSQGERETGPVPEGTLRRLIEDGQVRGKDFVWKQGFARWVPVESVKKLACLRPQQANPRVEKDLTVCVSVAVPGETPPGWLSKLMIGEVTHRYYLDGEYVGGGTSWKGYAFEIQASPGSHTLEVEGQSINSGRLGKVTLKVEFENHARYELRFTAANDGQFSEISSLDLLLKRS